MLIKVTRFVPCACKLPDYCTNEKFKIKEAAELLMEVYEQRMQHKDNWKQHAGDQA